MCVSWTRRSPAHPSRAPKAVQSGRRASGAPRSCISFSCSAAAAKAGTPRAEGCYPRLESCNNARAAMRPGVPTTPPEGFVPAPDT
jgi:hypothetical protein